MSGSNRTSSAAGGSPCRRADVGVDTCQSREFERLDTGDNGGVISVIMAHMVDDLVVVFEAQLAIRAGVRLRRFGCKLRNDESGARSGVGPNHALSVVSRAEIVAPSTDTASAAAISPYAVMSSDSSPSTVRNPGTATVAN